MVGIALPEAPAIKIQGRGDVILLDLQQAGLELEGDIAAYDQVAHLKVDIADSGKIKFR